MARLPGGVEWIIILVIVILLFGPGRISKIVGEVGRSIKSFREGLGSKDEQGEQTETETKEDKK